MKILWGHKTKQESDFLNMNFFVRKSKSNNVIRKTPWTIHQSGVCLPSLKKRPEPSLSCRFLEYAGNWRNLIGWFRRLETKGHWLFTENQNPRLVYYIGCWVYFLVFVNINSIVIIFSNVSNKATSFTPCNDNKQYLNFGCI